MSNETPTVIDWDTYTIHPEDLFPGKGARNESARDFYRSCQSHCCARHGCKYGHEGCPVVTGFLAQDHPCEECDNDLYGFAGGPVEGEVAYKVVFAARNTTPGQASEMAGMPTDEQFAAAVAKALTEVDLGNGWVITRVLGQD